MEEKAVIDQVVDERHAVLLVGENEREHVVPLVRLPPGAKAGTWLRVRFDGEKLVDATVDPEETERVRQRISEKMTQLRQRGRRLRPSE